MPEVIYRDKGNTQKAGAPTKLGNELSKTITKVYEKGSQAQKGAQPMPTSPDIWTSFTPTKGKTI